MEKEKADNAAWLDVSGNDAPSAPVSISAECCNRCGWPAHRLFRLRENAETEAVCASCWISFNLDTPSAAGGAICWIPGISPADVIYIQRMAIIAILAGNSNDKKNGQRVLRWLLRHKKETEKYLGTSRPAELAAALTRLHPSERLNVRLRMSGHHLILPAVTYEDLSLLLPADSDAATVLSKCDFPRL